MPVFKMPLLGEGDIEAQVVRVDVKEGSQIKAGDVILALETEKAVMDVPARFSGTVTKMMVKEGDSAKKGIDVLEYDESSGGSGAAKKNDADKETAEPAQKENKSEKVTEKPAEKKEKELAPVQTVKSTKTESSAPVSSEYTNTAPAPASPSVRKLARELGVDLKDVGGTRKDNRISIEDIKAYIKQRMQSGAGASTGASLAQPDMPDFKLWGPVHQEAVQGIRKATAAAMARAWTLIPHVTQNDAADISGLEAARKRLGASRKDQPGKITMTTLAVKACVKALKEFPQFNASLDMNKMQVVYKDYWHIAIAVDTPHGLMVPVIRDADKKSLVEIALETETLAQKARDRKLTLEEMQGSSFTITNLGGIGGTAFTPIVNWPNVAILGISRSKKEVILSEGQAVTRLSLPISLSYDHRIIDGADGAKFARRLCSLLESPLELMMGDENE